MHTEQGEGGGGGVDWSESSTATAPPPAETSWLLSAAADGVKTRGNWFVLQLCSGMEARERLTRT